MNMIAGASLPVFALILMLLAPLSASADDSKMTDAKKGDVARGVKAWTENCMRCHNARDPREYSDELWEPVITHMRIRAGLTGQQARDILAYFRQSN
ncbi:MAG: cytochrome c [Gammaproteobacteria bacterium]|nr:cytochrome c [Gammaproteobacteria bacterium]